MIIIKAETIIKNMEMNKEIIEEVEADTNRNLQIHKVEKEMILRIINNMIKILMINIPKKILLL